MRILYIDIDSTRPDHLGCYGYHRSTSPNIDRIASEGVRFTNFYASDAPCLPSRTAFFTGRFGINTGVVNHGGTNADMRVEGPGRGFRSQRTIHSLAGLMREAGWYPVSISPFPHRHSAYQVWEGFREMYDTGKNGSELADEVFPYVDRWLTHNTERDNWFLHVNFWDPHTPYNTPLFYGNPFEKDSPPAWLTQEIINQQRASYGPYDPVTPHGLPPGKKFNWLRGAETIANVKDWKKWIDGYDVGIHYSDLYIGEIIARLKELGIYDQTAIIISSDHGENHGELEVYGDHQTADQITNNVPLIIRWPGITDRSAEKAYNALQYNVDLAATLVELCGGTKPQSWDGSSFSNILKSGVDRGRDYLVLSQCAWSCQRSLRWGDHLLIRTYDTGYKNYPSWMLFNVKEDPHELHNLANEKPDLVGQGARMIDQWVAEQLTKTGLPDPLFQVIAEGGPLHPREDRQALIETLRRTGRAHHAEWIGKHGGKPRD